MAVTQRANHVERRLEMSYVIYHCNTFKFVVDTTMSLGTLDKAIYFKSESEAVDLLTKLNAVQSNYKIRSVSEFEPCPPAPPSPSH